MSSQAIDDDNNDVLGYGKVPPYGGATLAQVVNTFLLSSLFGVCALILFGIAIWQEWNAQLTPRASNRPPKVLKNALVGSRPREQSQNNDDDGDGDKGSNNQCRRWWNRLYCVTWIGWARRLTYQQALEGIPGTGTRDGGWAGNELRINLDGIILLKYHRLLAKVAGLATVLCMLVILPVYKTATCDPLVLGPGSCLYRWNLTDFENLTIVHVPVKLWQPVNFTTTFELENGTVVTIEGEDTGPEDVYDVWGYDVSWRLVLMTLCAMAIYMYTCYLLWYEWIDNLALRRVFYLEANHYQNRVQELNRLAVIQQAAKGKGDENVKNHFEGRGYFKDPQRPPNVYNPELRDNPPSIGLYSVLYQLPESLITFESDGKTQIERQQAATARFFDECVPSQAGFSSSVAAVTIIPSAKRVAKVWGEWYNCQSKVRRLRFIRKVLTEKIQREQEGKKSVLSSVNSLLQSSGQAMQNAAKVTAQSVATSLDTSLKTKKPSQSFIDTDSDDASVEHCPDGEAPGTESNVASMDSSGTADDAANGGKTIEVNSGADTGSNGNAKDGSLMTKLLGVFAGGSDDDDKKMEYQDENAPRTHGQLQINHLQIDEFQSQEMIEFTGDEESNSSSSFMLPDNFEYQTFDVDEFARQLGFVEEADMEDLVVGLGIEQLNMYAYESALAAGGPCIYGKIDQLILLANIDDLKDMEQETVDELKEANKALLEARAHVMRDKTDLKDDAGPIVVEEDGEKAEEKRRRPSLLRDLSTPAVVSSGLRSRNTGSVRETIANQWVAAQRVTTAMKLIPESDIEDGTENKAFKKHIIPCCRGPMKALPKYYGSKLEETGDIFLSALDHPSYAIVTFTSRQAAVAARQCLADGGAQNVWKQADDIPVPPLADAPPRDIFFFRGCCRPVTMTINYKEKKIRRIIVLVFLFFFFTLYTYPLSQVSRIITQTTDRALSSYEGGGIYNTISGFMAGVANTLFFSFCPQLFKYVAFFEGSSTSRSNGERKALLYYWLFMLITAFSGTSLATMLFNWFNRAEYVEDSFRAALTSIGESIPTERAPVWLNWIVFRFGFTLTLGYLAQMNTFLTRILNLKWFNRVMKGGGSGSPVPYRIYVDSGVVFMCITSLAPIVPLIAPAAFIYYLVFQPILRWLLTFVYKPQYDGGGDKWFQLHSIIISAMIVGQVLLGVVLGLRYYVGGIVIGLCAIPTYFWHLVIMERFGRAYRDAALLQTSRLDGWEDCRSQVQREEYRRWLVDCHKASYVATCLLGCSDGSSDIGLTGEPALVVPRATDIDHVDNSTTGTAGLPSSRKFQLVDPIIEEEDDDDVALLKKKTSQPLPQRRRRLLANQGSAVILSTVLLVLSPSHTHLVSSFLHTCTSPCAPPSPSNAVRASDGHDHQRREIVACWNQQRGDLVMGSEQEKTPRVENHQVDVHDDDAEDQDSAYEEEQRQRRIIVEKILHEQDKEFKEERRKEVWGEFADAKTKEDIVKVEQSIKEKIARENEQKAQVARMQGVVLEVLDAPDDIDGSVFEENGNVQIKAGSASNRGGLETLFETFDEDLKEEWAAMETGADGGDDDMPLPPGGLEDVDVEQSDSLTPTHTVTMNGKIVSREALKGFRVQVGSAGGWSLEVFPGDFVVHRRYGIGRFEGTKLIPRTKLTEEEKKSRDARRAELYTEELRRISKKEGGVTADRIKEIKDLFGSELDMDPISNPQSTVLEITYSDGIVHVPVDRAYRLSRYRAGDSVVKPRLSKVRGDQWRNSRRKVEETTLELAQDVLALYATRETLQRPPFDPAMENEVAEFERTFHFEPTPDQQKCFEDVENDMVWRSRPMDRLVCGDVGFGKTEVAMRAIYRSVVNGRQAAFLAPTGVLASQHYKNVIKRCGEGTPFNKRVALLRGGMTKASKAGRELRRQIEEGEVDIIVGTHALLSKDLEYKDLGLLVVDEEQRFGVKQKERLKLICGGVDVLTLSATPIPRTLQMSLSGVRDTSTIRSPPPMRKPTITYVQDFSEDILKYAIGNELERNGQCYYVVPRIAMLAEAEKAMKNVFPDIRIVTAHGRMGRNIAEENVAAFAEGDYDVLLATTVIENGVDIPSVNTIIVQDSQFFGMSTLYQLRGRVGRSDSQAFAYFLCNEEKVTEQSMMRLQAIGELNELGSGFDVANRDLEIRGAGSLLGTEQSGMAARVGFDLYMRMLKKSIRQLRGLDLPLVPRTNVLLPKGEGSMEVRKKNKRGEVVSVHAFEIPEAYIVDEGERQKAETAARLAETSAALVELTNEWKETYGPLPASLQNKLKTMHLHACTRRLGIDLIGLVENEEGQMDCIMRSPGLRPRHWGTILPKLPKGVAPRGFNAVFPARFTRSGDEEEVMGGKKIDLKELMEDDSLDEDNENWDALDQEELEAMKDISSAYNITSLEEVDIEQYPRLLLRNFGTGPKNVDRILQGLLPLAKAVYEIQEKEKENAKIAARLREKQETLKDHQNDRETYEKQRLFMD